MNNLILIVLVLLIFIWFGGSKVPSVLRKNKEILLGLAGGLILCSFFGMRLEGLGGKDIFDSLYDKFNCMAARSSAISGAPEGSTFHNRLRDPSRAREDCIGPWCGGSIVKKRDWDYAFRNPSSECDESAKNYANTCLNPGSAARVKNIGDLWTILSPDGVDAVDYFNQAVYMPDADDTCSKAGEELIYNCAAGEGDCYELTVTENQFGGRGGIGDPDYQHTLVGHNKEECKKGQRDLKWTAYPFGRPPGTNAPIAERGGLSPSCRDGVEKSFDASPLLTTDTPPCVLDPEEFNKYLTASNIPLTSTRATAEQIRFQNECDNKTQGVACEDITIPGSQLAGRSGPRKPCVVAPGH